MLTKTYCPHLRKSSLGSSTPRALCLLRSWSTVSSTQSSPTTWAHRRRCWIPPATWSGAPDISIYGDLRNLTGERQACPFRWPGQYEDAETGLYYNRFRYYSLDGSFTCADLIGIQAGLNLYEYVGCPLSWVDPLGLTRGLWGISSDMTAATKIIGKRAYYKHITTGLWWSKDTAGHGGSAWKVFTEGKGGNLDWFRDADEYGDFIDPSKKHKGAKGKKMCG